MLHVRLRLAACPRLFDVGGGLPLEWRKYVFVPIPAKVYGVLRGFFNEFSHHCGKAIR